VRINDRVLLNLKIQFKKNRLASAAVIILCLVILASIFAFLSPYDPDKITIGEKFQQPSLKHFFGTDNLGRDYFTRALYGGRISLLVGFSSMAVSVIIGTTVGIISGFFGGIIDSIIMRIIDMLMCIPQFFLILIINAYLSPSIVNIVVIIGMFGWMGVARIVRSETLSYKEREYILCAKVLGADKLHIIKKHIIPNTLSSVIVASSINIAGAILTESSLSFFGLGVQQPQASWGSMLQSAQSYMSDRPYLAVFPGLLILLTVLSFNVLGDVLRVGLEPKVNEQ
jgi:peptide/nickel transport system permease protein